MPVVIYHFSQKWYCTIIVIIYYLISEETMPAFQIHYKVNRCLRIHERDRSFSL